MKLIVGLGNPGAPYKMTRHNVGFMALEVLRVRLKFPDFRDESKFKVEVSRSEFNGEKVILARPQTFMNLSGEAVRGLKQFYKLADEEVWVIYDDIDLPLGMLRIRESGSAGTHNGMKSIIQALASELFPRFRLGIESRGTVSPAQQDLSSFVLEPFRNEEFFQVEEMLKNCAEAVVFSLKKGVQEAIEKPQEWMVSA